MTEEIADLLVEELHAKAATVGGSEAHSWCMTIRGIRQAGKRLCVTSAMERGVPHWFLHAGRN